MLHLRRIYITIAAVRKATPASNAPWPNKRAASEEGVMVIDGIGVDVVAEAFIRAAQDVKV